jgi:eukaryotic-like serine/threonine-protein kinase
MALAPGTHLGPYEITGPLGSGGMGEVYRARDTRLERTVAIKILPAQPSSDPVLKQRFEREAKTISSLNHPHICVVHDVGHQDEIDYLVMEFVGERRWRGGWRKGRCRCQTVSEPGQKASERSEAIERRSISGEADWGRGKPAQRLRRTAKTSRTTTAKRPGRFAVDTTGQGG